MDLGFFRRAEQRFASRSAASFDYGTLLATLRAHQAQSDTALAEAECAGDLPGTHQFSLVDILLGEPCWREAVAARGGSFNPAYALPGHQA